jgi:hypothetical protein
MARQLLQYAQNKATPAIGLGKELVSGHDFFGRPLPFPWVSDKGTPKKPPVSWGEYALSHAPIPLAGAARYVYDELRKSGASAGDAMTWMRAAAIGAISGTTGIELKESTPSLHQAVRQQRAAHALQGR